MTDPLQDEPTIAKAHFLRGRGRLAVLGPAVGALVAAGLIYLFEVKMMPVLHDVLKPVYFVIAAAAVILTARALRARGGRRREGDRRNADRRHDGDGR
ncbi:MAG: hypothetical protein ABIS03_07545 [Gemmatimonadaceae bacterium]